MSQQARHALAKMAAMIIQLGPPLTFLNLSNCGIETALGEQILDALCDWKHDIRKIKFLLLNDNDSWWARDQSVEKLAEFLSRQQSLEEVWMQDNYLSASQ